MAKPTDTQVSSGTATSAATAAMMAFNPLASNAWLSFMSESARFLTERLHQDLDAQKAMMACKSPTELLQLQSAFLKTAMDQYTEHATRIQAMMTTATTNAAIDLQSGHSRGYDDVPI